MTTKDQALALAREAGFMKFLKPESRPEMICDPDSIHRLVTLAFNEGLERARQECLAEVADIHSSNESRNTAEHLANAIQSLKEPTP